MVIRLRRAWTQEEAEASSVVLRPGEPAGAIDTGEIRIGNGVDKWVDLPTMADIIAAAVAGDTSLAQELASRFVPLTDVRVWSNPLGPAGSGGGVIRVDGSAAPFIPDYTSASGSRGIIAMGRDALGVATGAPGCIAIGENSMGKAQPGEHNIAFGSFSLTHLDGGHRNLGFGSLSGHFLTSGYQNIYMGRDSGHSVTTGYQNVGIGYRACGCVEAPVGLSGSIELMHPVTGYRNTGVGTNSLSYIFGSNNTALGYRSGGQARDISNSVFVGSQAGQNLGADLSENGFLINPADLAGTYTQSGPTITVNAAGHGLSTGKYVNLNFTSGELTIAGSGQWYPVTVVDADTFTITSLVEREASGGVTVQDRETSTVVSLPGSNVLVGFNAAGDSTRSGGNNVIVGESAGRQSSGDQNTLVGGRSGFNLTSGRQVSGLGYNSARATFAGAQLTTEVNVTSLGHDSRVVGPNTVMIGNSTQDVYTRDGTVKGPSDERDKADIRDTSLGLDFINRVRPREFRWDQRAFYTETDDEGNVTQLPRDGSRKRNRFHQGVIAQEVASAAEEMDVDFAGLQHHQPEDGEDLYTVSYTEFIAPLIKAVQELSARVAELEGSS